MVKTTSPANQRRVNSHFSSGQSGRNALPYLFLGAEQVYLSSDSQPAAANADRQILV